MSLRNTAHPNVAGLRERMASHAAGRATGHAAAHAAGDAAGRAAVPGRTPVQTGDARRAATPYFWFPPTGPVAAEVSPGL